MDTKNNLPSVAPVESESEYNAILRRAVALIEEARSTIAKNVSQTVNSTHWQIGQLLHEKKLESTHGSRVVRRLSVDLKQRYPKMGMSPRNLWYMKTFFKRYSHCDAKVQRAVALLPWSHNILLINKKLDDEATLYYAEETVKKGWNRDLLLNAIKLKMFQKQVVSSSDNNFAKAKIGLRWNCHLRTWENPLVLQITNCSFQKKNYCKSSKMNLRTMKNKNIMKKETTNNSYLGNIDLLKLHKTAFLAASTIPPDMVLKCYDWAVRMANEGQK